MDSKRIAVAGALILATLPLLSCGSDTTGPGTGEVSIITTSLPDGYVGEPYSAGVDAEGGEGSYTWEITTGALPPGLEMSLDDLTDRDLLITGTPDRQGRFRFTVKVQAGDGRTDSVPLVLDIQPPPDPLEFETLALVPALAGYAYEAQLEAVGGIGEYTWAVVGGTLPEGLSLEATGRFTGAPAVPDTVDLIIQVESGPRVAQRDFTLVVHAEDATRFDITLFALNEIAPSLRDNVEEAVRRWEAAIIGDLPRRDVTEGSLILPCRGFEDMADGTSIDDVIMIVNISAIDGPGNVLGSAGPCYVRSAGGLPFLGALTLDEEDLFAIGSEETVTDIIQHEMAHILGFGPLWEDKDLLQGEWDGNPRYIGEQAVTEYQTAGGADATIPVEGSGGFGTAFGHWREGDFGAELMTGFIEPVGTDNYLSTMTIASFADLGYTVDLSAADETPLLARSRHAGDTGTAGYDITGVDPIFVLRPDGTVVDTIPPLGGTR